MAPCFALGHRLGSTKYACAGPVYEVITSVPDGRQISNDSLILTPTGANTLTGKLPPSFNATKLLSIGTYQAVFTYYPTSNFTQPFPLVVGFQVVVSLPASSWHMRLMQARARPRRCSAAPISSGCRRPQTLTGGLLNEGV